MVRSLSRSKFWVFDPRSHPKRTEPRFWPGEGILLRNFMPVVRKVSPQDFLLVLTAPLPKIVIPLCWQWCEQMGQIRKFWFGKSILLRNFTPVVSKIPLRIFSPVWAAYKSTFLTFVRLNGDFDQCATRTWIRSFWGATLCQIFEILTWRHFGPLRHWFRKFPSTIFYPFWAPHNQKLRIGLFDHCVTRKGLKNPPLMAG